MSVFGLSTPDQVNYTALLFIVLLMTKNIYFDRIDNGQVILKENSRVINLQHHLRMKQLDANIRFVEKKILETKQETKALLLQSSPNIVSQFSALTSSSTPEQRRRDSLQSLPRCNQPIKDEFDVETYVRSMLPPSISIFKVPKVPPLKSTAEPQPGPSGTKSQKKRKKVKSTVNVKVNK